MSALPHRSLAANSALFPQRAAKGVASLLPSCHGLLAGAERRRSRVLLLAEKLAGEPHG